MKIVANSRGTSKFKKNLLRQWLKIHSRVQVELDYLKFRKAATYENRFPIRWKDRRLFIRDKTSTSGFPRDYVYHTAWAARILERTRPVEHIDISSSIYFCALVSAFVPMRFYDYRPAKLYLKNLQTAAGDLMKLPFENASVESISCMHVVEHVGLGRYGDAIDPNGDLKAISELKRVVRPGGQLLFVTPVGQARVRFNANRIYSFEQVISYFSAMELLETALITDDGKSEDLVVNAPQQLFDRQYEATGCFLFKRIVPSTAAVK